MTPAEPTGIPTSWATSTAISGSRAMSPSDNFWMSVVRASTGVADPGPNAVRAAATALSTSGRLASGTRPSDSSVAALTTSMVPLPTGSTHSPPM
jgi:hypothetical protein